MGILSRFTDIMKANINSALDKIESPEKMVEQLIIDAKRDLAEVKRETAGVIAARHHAQRLYDKELADVERFTAAAKRALKAGDEADALKIAERISKEQKELDQAKIVLDMATANEKKMREMYDKLSQDIVALEAKRNNLKGLVAATKAQQTVNKAIGRTAKGVGTKMSDYEDKINEAFDRAAAEADLDAEAEFDEADYLLDKYSDVESATALVSKLKAEMALDFNESDCYDLEIKEAKQSAEDVLKVLKAGINNV